MNTAITDRYLDFCQTLWADWCEAQKFHALGCEELFEMEHAPEPYLRFGSGVNPLYVLLTNPGAGMLHQHRDVVTSSGGNCINSGMSYHDAALTLGEFYRDPERPLSKGARRRNKALDHIKQEVGADCIVQFESLPFHSRSLPGKNRIAKLLQDDEFLHRYASLLREAMRDVSVVALSGVGSRQSISAASIGESPWLSWQAWVLGIDCQRIQIIALTEKHGKSTCAFLYQKDSNRTCGFVLTMGSNSFPAEAGRKLIAQEFLRQDAP